jgi:hypothetical protein
LGLRAIPTPSKSPFQLLSPRHSAVRRENGRHATSACTELQAFLSATLPPPGPT